MINEQTITINGLDVSYIQAQTADEPNFTLVFLHGWGGTKESWEKNIGELSTQYCCIALDLPGFGKSQQPITPWDTFDYADLVEGFCTTLNLQNIVLVGKSFGGRVAIAYANKYPQTLKSLVLASSAGTEERSLLTRFKIYLAKLGRVLTEQIPFMDTELLRQRLYRLLNLKEESEYKREVKKKVTNQNLAGLLSQILTPALVVWGEDDLILPLSLGEKMARQLPNATLFVLPKAGHWAHETHYQDFNTKVAAFLEQESD